MSWIGRGTAEGVFCDRSASVCDDRCRAEGRRQATLERIARKGDWRRV